MRGSEGLQWQARSGQSLLDWLSRRHKLSSEAYRYEQRCRNGELSADWQTPYWWFYVCVCVCVFTYECVLLGLGQHCQCFHIYGANTFHGFSFPFSRCIFFNHKSFLTSFFFFLKFLKCMCVYIWKLTLPLCEWFFLFVFEIVLIYYWCLGTNALAPEWM